MYKIIKDFPGSPDGCKVIDYKAGDTYTIGSDFSADLAAVAVREKWAIEVESDKPDKPARKKRAAKK